MHPYSIDSSERFWIPLAILIVSVFCALGAKLYLDSLNLHNTLGEFFYIVSLFVDLSVIIFYEVFYLIFDKWLWKLPLIPVKVPNLNGEWKGTLDSNYNETNDNSLTRVTPKMEITQTWQDIEIRLKTDQSTSETVTAAFFTKNPNAVKLSYQYLSDPNPHTIESMHKHEGTGWVTLSKDRKSFEGSYYNGRDSENHGSIKFEKIN